jgi:tRNA nucleotidyltransferase (CCA-adding enzyme)
MKIYEVGGAVRDELLGLRVQDRDWVVVGATPEEMEAQGFKPVGRDFPVFLHPKTHEEYALARTERKTAPGYRGFTLHASPAVTLEEDLQRRDLTINAMAREPGGALVDPFGGVDDLRNRILRHVSAAFIEDPVRVLRVARFAARFKEGFNFTVAPKTYALMEAMVERGEVDALVPERVWQELSRGLNESTPSELFRVLHRCGALSRITPELMGAWLNRSEQALETVDHAAVMRHPLGVRWSAFLVNLLQDNAHSGREVIVPLCERIRVPTDIRDLARITAENFADISAIAAASAEKLLTVIERTDGVRRPQRFEEILATHACCMQAREGNTAQAEEDTVWGRLNRALQATLKVPTGDIVKDVEPADIPARIREARLRAIAATLH